MLIILYRIFPAHLSDDSQCEGEGEGLYHCKVTLEDFSLEISPEEGGDINTHKALEKFLTRNPKPHATVPIREVKPGVGYVNLSPTHSIVARHAQFDLYISGKYISNVTFPFYSSTTTRCEFITSFFEEKSLVPVLATYLDESVLVMLKISGEKIEVLIQNHLKEFYTAIPWSETEIAIWCEKSLRIYDIVSWESFVSYKDYSFVGATGTLQLCPHQLGTGSSKKGRCFVKDDAGVYCVEGETLATEDHVSLRKYKVDSPFSSLKGAVPHVLVCENNTLYYWIDQDEHHLHVLEKTNNGTPTHLEKSDNIMGGFKKVVSMPVSQFHYGNWKQTIQVLALDEHPGFFICHAQDRKVYLVDIKGGKITEIGSDCDGFYFPIRDGIICTAFSSTSIPKLFELSGL